MIHQIFRGSCTDLLASAPNDLPLIFADPPDNLGLGYNEYKDNMPKDDYYDFLHRVIVGAALRTRCFWLSYYWEHDLEIKWMVRNLIKYRHPTMTAKTFIWRYTFGQHNDRDFGSGFRYLLRLCKPGAKYHPDDVRVESERQRIGDARADPRGRVPDDVWDFPEIFSYSRVVGNAQERRAWHPTQHPVALISRIIRMHSDVGDTVVDLFGGTGTMIRAARETGRRAVISEISADYCHNIASENELQIEVDPSVVW